LPPISDIEGKKSACRYRDLPKQGNRFLEEIVSGCQMLYTLNLLNLTVQ